MEGRGRRERERERKGEGRGEERVISARAIFRDSFPASCVHEIIKANPFIRLQVFKQESRSFVCFLTQSPPLHTHPPPIMQFAQHTNLAFLGARPSDISGLSCVVCLLGYSWLNLISSSEQDALSNSPEVCLSARNSHSLLPH